MRRLTAVALAGFLIAAGMVRSPLFPLCVMALMGALVGLLVATQTGESRDLLRMPAMVAVAALVLVGIGQLGVLGILVGLALLLAATPIVPAAASRHRARHVGR